MPPTQAPLNVIRHPTVQGTNDALIRLGTIFKGRYLLQIVPGDGPTNRSPRSVNTLSTFIDIILITVPWVGSVRLFGALLNRLVSPILPLLWPAITPPWVILRIISSKTTTTFASRRSSHSDDL